MYVCMYVCMYVYVCVCYIYLIWYKTYTLTLFPPLSSNKMSSFFFFAIFTLFRWQDSFEWRLERGEWERQRSLQVEIQTQVSRKRSCTICQCANH